MLAPAPVGDGVKTVEVIRKKSSGAHAEIDYKVFANLTHHVLYLALCLPCVAEFGR